MRGNPVAYRNLNRHLREILNYLEIALDADFVLEELNSAIYECEKTFGKRHHCTIQLRNQMKDLYKKYIERKALPLEEKDEKKLQSKINELLKKYYQNTPK
ncbi:MAG: hypothetical protein KGD59_14570 [Candidatus Heimdallarchaeota archaeon]|nr:hypothetical protein [Candidatus Heimdallarchaeota archaeon]MBY8995772.1 hypothetical protein [Candidatus Heimdallarchaeota archaeon]